MIDGGNRRLLQLHEERVSGGDLAAGQCGCIYGAFSGESLKGSHAAAGGNLRTVALDPRDRQGNEPAERVDQEASAARTAHADGAHIDRTVH